MIYFEIVDALEAEREAARLAAFFNSGAKPGVFFYRCRKSAAGVWIAKGFC